MKFLPKKFRDYGKKSLASVHVSLQEMAANGGVDDGDDDFELEQDIFRIVAEHKSICFVYCSGVFVVQVMILLLMWSDLIKDDDRALFEQDDNRWNIPVAVDTNVAVVQFLALVIAMVSQDDVLTSIDALISVIYNRRIVEDVGIPHASLFRWRFFNMLRWTEGMMTLLLSLLIVIQVSSKQAS
jgi:hypothetical protein